MDFEPSYNYLLAILAPVSSTDEARRLIEDAIRSILLPIQSTYRIEDFIKICNELVKRDGKTKVISRACLAQANCYKALQNLSLR